MTILQHTDERLVVQVGVRVLNQTTMTLDRTQGIARIERATLLVLRRREDLPMHAIRDVGIAEQNDPASGAERYLPTLRLASGRVIAMPPFDSKTEAESTAAKVRAFIGLPR